MPALFLPAFTLSHVGRLKKLLIVSILCVPATDSSGAVWAIKISRLERGPKEKKVKGTTQSDGAIGLAVERRVYQVQLPGLPNVPALPPQCYGDANGHRYLVMQRLGVNLKEKAAEVGGTFSPAAAALVATRLVRDAAVTVSYHCNSMFGGDRVCGVCVPGVHACASRVFHVSWKHWRSHIGAASCTRT